MFKLSSDEKLIGKALDGSQSSWVALVKRYEKLIFNYCLRMTFNHADAMDLMQEVFLALYRNLPAYRGDGQFKSWMMRIAANKTTDFLRSRGRNPLHLASQVEGEELPYNSSPEQDCLLHSENRRILRMLSSLPEEQQQVIELKFFQHLTFEEINQLTGIAVSTLKTRLYTALQRLKGEMEVQNAL